MSESLKKISFVYYLLVSLGISVKLSIILKTDNIGTIFMAKNPSSGVCTRHVDYQYHFIREHMEDGFTNIVFVRTNGNDADVLTKNVNAMKFLGKC
jgi:hypothetical protein